MEYLCLKLHFSPQFWYWPFVSSTVVTCNCRRHGMNTRCSSLGPACKYSMTRKQWTLWSDPCERRLPLQLRNKLLYQPFSQSLLIVSTGRPWCSKPWWHHHNWKRAILWRCPHHGETSAEDNVFMNAETRIYSCSCLVCCCLLDEHENEGKSK